jgi:hypothetical protein
MISFLPEMQCGEGFAQVRERQAVLSVYLRRAYDAESFAFECSAFGARHPPPDILRHGQSRSFSGRIRSV